MARDQAAKLAKEIQELKRQNQRLAKSLADIQATRAPAPSLRDLPKKSPAKLETSSMQAYAGMAIAIVLVVIPVTLWLRASLFLALCLIGSGFAWRSPATYKLKKPWKIFLMICVVGAIAWGGWVNVQKEIRAEEAPPKAMYLLSWGIADHGRHLRIVSATPPKFEGTPASDVIANGDLLSGFANRYKLVAVCFTYDGLEDEADVKGLSKSAAFDIVNGRISMRIPWNEKLQREYIAGYRRTNYVALLLPRKLEPNQFDSIREATERGAIILESTSGPP